MIARMDAPIVGSEALNGGTLTRGQLRWNYRSIFPDIYLPRSIDRSLDTMTLGAWLWSGRRATITGRAAAALHGAKWVSETSPVEMLWRNNHCPPGIIARDERFAPDEVMSLRGLAVATPETVLISHAICWAQPPSPTSTLSLARRESRGGT